MRQQRKIDECGELNDIPVENQAGRFQECFSVKDQIKLVLLRNNNIKVFADFLGREFFHVTVTGNGRNSIIGRIKI